MNRPVNNMPSYLCLLLLTSLSVISYGQNVRWPETWTSDVNLKINYCCGVKDESKTIYISANNSYVEERTGEKPRQSITLSFSEAELQELLGTLKKNNVVTIKSSAAKTVSADKEIISISFSVAGKNYTINNSTAEPLQGNAKERFYSVLNYVDKIVEKKRLTAKVGFIFKFDKSVIQSGKDLQIKIINPPTDISFKADRIPSSAVINLSPGEYEMQAILKNPGTPEGSTTEINSLTTGIKINTRAIQQVTLLLKDDQLSANY